MCLWGDGVFINQYKSTFYNLCKKKYPEKENIFKNLLRIWNVGGDYFHWDTLKNIQHIGRKPFFQNLIR